MIERARLAWRLGFSLALPVLVVFGLVRASQQLPRLQTQANLAAGELIGSAKLGQVFTADQAGVYRIDVFLATYARVNTGEIIFHVRTFPTATKDLVTLRMDAAQVEDNAYHTFLFAPLPNRPGDKLYFYLEAPQASHGNAITAWGSDSDVYRGGQAVALWPLNTDVKDLAFRVYYRAQPMQALGGMLAQLAADKPGIWGSKGVYVGLLLIYLGLLVWLGWRGFAAGPNR